MLNCDIRDYGAVGDGAAMDTAAVQAAIDDCGAQGGGRVTLSGGRFLCGRIDMKSGVELHIERDAVLLGSKNGLDFPEIETDAWRVEYAPRFNRRCFIYAENCEDIALTGRGAIDCQGESYIEPLPAGATDFFWPYRRLSFPEGFEDNGSRGLHPAQRRMCSLSPARVALFMGCKNVLVEDVTMRNQPAGWSYWVCGCEGVAFHRAVIDASVLYPNNDGIHVNCSRDVTISDCRIRCGDDGVVVRAYSLPLGRNAACERVTVTNCSIVSHSGGVRVGWIGDGVIRDCAFSNLAITDSAVGIDIRLPGNDTGVRQSDEGEEATLIENLSFSNIVMDRLFHEPVFINISEHCRCEAIRDLYFTGVHARAAHMPCVNGRGGCPVKNVRFNGCTFAQLRREDIPGFETAPFCDRAHTLRPYFQHVENLSLENTAFSVL
ncbi:MAG: right-handed parallel beta-helix repeat-containing protein [Clostridia bacterium]|nr:right-handed parallel beta-helix repeat-containing protein [Clostridia bacterium]